MAMAVAERRAGNVAVADEIRSLLVEPTAVEPVAVPAPDFNPLAAQEAELRRLGALIVRSFAPGWAEFIDRLTSGANGRQ